MLGKLLKHEFRTTGRYIALLLIILIAVTPLTALYINFSVSDTVENFTINGFNIFKILRIIAILVYVASLISVTAATTVLLIYNLYKSMVTKQGYLTHMLPVPTSLTIISKTIVFFVWKAVSFIVALFSLLAFTYILDVWEFKDISYTISRIIHYVNVPKYIPCIILIVISMIFGSLQKILMYFASFAVGHRMNGHPFLGSVIAYIAGSSILGTISLIVTSISNAIFIDSPYLDLVDIYYIEMIPALILTIIFGTVFYLISVYIGIFLLTI